MSLNILIAEDSLYVCQQYETVLKKEGHNVSVSRDGEECLSMYNNQMKSTDQNENPFDVVVLDQHMPKKNGAQVAQEILTNKPHQRIIFATAHLDYLNNSESEQVSQSAEVLKKPFLLQELVQKINE